jgi:hypothetical protein
LAHRALGYCSGAPAGGKAALIVSSVTVAKSTFEISGISDDGERRKSNKYLKSITWKL